MKCTGLHHEYIADDVTCLLLLFGSRSSSVTVVIRLRAGRFGARTAVGGTIFFPFLKRAERVWVLPSGHCGLCPGG